MTYPIYLDFDYTSLRDSSERDFVLALVDCSLRNETALLAEVTEWFQLDWMMDPLYRSVSEAVLSLSRNQQPLSSSTLSRCILASVKSANETLETAHKLLAGAFGWYHLRYYGMQLYDEYRRRRLAEDSAEVASQLCEGAPVVEAMDNLSLLSSRYQDLAIDRVDAADGAIAELIADIDRKSVV